MSKKIISVSFFLFKIKLRLKYNCYWYLINTDYYGTVYCAWRCFTSILRLAAAYPFAIVNHFQYFFDHSFLCHIVMKVTKVGKFTQNIPTVLINEYHFTQYMVNIIVKHFLLRIVKCKMASRASSMICRSLYSP